VCRVPCAVCRVPCAVCRVCALACIAHRRTCTCACCKHNSSSRGNVFAQTDSGAREDKEEGQRTIDRKGNALPTALLTGKRQRGHREGRGVEHKALGSSLPPVALGSRCLASPRHPERIAEQPRLTPSLRGGLAMAGACCTNKVAEIVTEECYGRSVTEVRHTEERQTSTRPRTGCVAPSATGKSKA
jgi:hypothetical protein